MLYVRYMSKFVKKSNTIKPSKLLRPVKQIPQTPPKKEPLNWTIPKEERDKYLKRSWTTSDKK